jgi:hypothetical protein
MEFDLPLSIAVCSALNPLLSTVSFYLSIHQAKIPNIDIRFSVGSGRPPVISNHHFDECAKVLHFSSYNARDELVLAGVKLYQALWRTLSSNDIQKESPTWQEIDNLRRSQENIYSKPILTTIFHSYLR